MIDALDMTDGRDRVLLQSVIQTKRWPTTPEQRARYLKGLDIAMKLALEKQDQRAITSCIKTMVLIEGQNQSDEHLMDKNARIDSGDATERVQVVYRDEESIALGRLHGLRNPTNG